jgi:hypothetical protein
MKNVVSFDVEDYFHVGAFADKISQSEWATLPSRVEANTEKILEMLAKNGTLGTFFVLGWVADHFPALVRRIAEAGHEIACQPATSAGVRRPRRNCGWTHGRPSNPSKMLAVSEFAAIALPAFPLLRIPFGLWRYLPNSVLNMTPAFSL